MAPRKKLCRLHSTTDRAFNAPKNHQESVYRDIIIQKGEKQMNNTDRQTLIDMFNNADAEQLDQMGALMIAIHEGTEEEKAILNDEQYWSISNVEMTRILKKYISILHERLRNGTVLQKTAV